MKNRIIWKFFGAFVLLALIAIFTLNFFVSLKLQDSFEHRITQKLKSNATLVAEILSEDLAEAGYANIRNKTTSLARKLELRITVIDPAGRVLADSDKDHADMQDHADRPEVRQALTTGFGQSSRPSDTLGYAMKYVAVRLGSRARPAAVIRFALPLSEVQLQIRHIYRVVLLGALAATAIALIVAYFISKSITSPIGRMQQIARKIADGDFTSKINLKSSDELGQLAKSLNAMSDELQLKIENLKRMDRIRTDFVANVSHELKTPLTLIKGYIETLQAGALDDAEKTRRFVAIMKKHAERLDSIINDLLGLSELELSKDSLHKTTFDLKTLAEEVTMGFERALAEKRQTLKTALTGDDFTITADSDKIERALANLIDNAVKYTDQGGKIDLSIAARPDDFVLAVRDNGIGIPKEHLDRVFERFYRVDKARSRRLGGTGLGLGIAKHIVRAHRGRIEIQSRPNAGTTVSITLPRK